MTYFAQYSIQYNIICVRENVELMFSPGEDHHANVSSFSTAAVCSPAQQKPTTQTLDVVLSFCQVSSGRIILLETSAVPPGLLDGLTA